ncbi:alkaline phosphatase [Escherichia coli]
MGDWKSQPHGAEGPPAAFLRYRCLTAYRQDTTTVLRKKTGKPDYVTDSAASTTAWLTGVKTYNGALGRRYSRKDYQSFWKWQSCRSGDRCPPQSCRMPRPWRRWHM